MISSLISFMCYAVFSCLVRGNRYFILLAWKPSALTVAPSLSPSALNGNLIQLTGAAGASPYLPQAYGTAGGIPYSQIGKHFLDSTMIM